MRRLQVERYKRFNMFMYRVIDEIQSKEVYNRFLEVLIQDNQFILEKLQEENEMPIWKNKGKYSFM